MAAPIRFHRWPGLRRIHRGGHFRACPFVNGHFGCVVWWPAWAGPGTHHGVPSFNLAGGVRARVLRRHEHGAHSVGHGTDAPFAQALTINPQNGQSWNYDTLECDKDGMYRLP